MGIFVAGGDDGFMSAFQKSRLLGFLGYKMFELQQSRLLYISTTMIEPDQQRQGLSDQLTHCIRPDLGHKHLDQKYIGNYPIISGVNPDTEIEYIFGIRPCLDFKLLDI